MPDFDVGVPELNELLEWVDQPPPQQGRDTHALSFHLVRTPDTPGLEYSGLLFYRPGNPAATLMQRLPGLSGVAKKLLSPTNCERGVGDLPPLGTIDPQFQDHSHVLVEVRFRPPRAFGFLQFCEPATGTRGLLLGEVVRGMDAAPVKISPQPSVTTPIVFLTISADDGDWNVSLQKTTVLFSPI
jgi:hypothetical protein